MAFEASIKKQRIDVSELTTGRVKKAVGASTKPLFNVGDFVTVDEDLSPGNKSYGGQGYVDSVSRVGRAFEYDVKYLETEGQRLERNVTAHRIVLDVCPQQSAQLDPNPRKKLRPRANNTHQLFGRKEIATL